jgi:hypothetical protein
MSSLVTWGAGLTGGLLTAAGEGAFSQVVLARHKDTQKLAALKVVYLQSPEMDDEHLAVTRKCALFRHTLCRVTVCGLHLKHVGLAFELHEHPGRCFQAFAAGAGVCPECMVGLSLCAGRQSSCRCWTARASWRAATSLMTAASWCAMTELAATTAMRLAAAFAR